MKKVTFFAIALAVSCAGSAFATSPSDIVDPAAGFVSTKTRAEVKAQLKEFKQESLESGAFETPETPSSVSVKTRAQVKAETLAAIKNGEIYRSDIGE